MSRGRVRRADKDLVRAVALDVLGEHGIERAPVDPFGIAESLGIVVQSSDELEGSFSGCLLQAGASFGILYSTGIRNEGYQGFTVAHELGHFSLTDHDRVLFEKGGAPSLGERVHFGSVVRARGRSVRCRALDPRVSVPQAS